MKLHIGPKESTYVALEASKRGPIKVKAAEDGAPADRTPVPAVVAPSGERKAPPRLRKPSPDHDKCLAPTGHLESHRARLREAVGTLIHVRRLRRSSYDSND
jgi:hypothetical protein